MCENLYLNHVAAQCQIPNKVKKERDKHVATQCQIPSKVKKEGDKCKHQSHDFKQNTHKQIDVYTR